MNKHKEILGKIFPNIPLYRHTEHVVFSVTKLAEYCGFDKNIAVLGAVLHDIGKVSPVFQERLTRTEQPVIPDTPFRHEIASLLFLSLLDEEIHGPVIEMIIGHHKSISNDVKNRGILDLIDSFNCDDNDAVFKFHIERWEDWSPTALDILQYFGIPVRTITKDEAYVNYKKVVNYCERVVMEFGYSKWKGLLMSADHIGSALMDSTRKYVNNMFLAPDLSFYDRRHELYPLSFKPIDYSKPYSLVTAPTSCGKTDFGFRLCKRGNRVFYTLPFQTSINSMYERIVNDLKKDQPNLDIRLLHASSKLSPGVNKQEKSIQNLAGSAIKILTPHQLASLVFGSHGYEALILDIKGQDVILDEIHTYTKITRAIILKLVEVLKYHGCRIHIFTATMPKTLYKKILKILGQENTLEVQLTDEELNMFDRHIVHKIPDFNAAETVIERGVKNSEKMLVICNQVSRSQNVFIELKNKYPDVPMLLIHSRFKRGVRNKLERQLKDEFNVSVGPCIVVSTQIVEVSLDISFDMMVTECAPMDALIQRFGRINRARSFASIGVYKHVYIIAPPDNSNTAKPYDLDVLQRTFDILPDGELLKESSIQEKIDVVYPTVDTMTIDKASRFQNDEWCVDYLTHTHRSVFLDLLEIDSAICIVETDKVLYEASTFEERAELEIPVISYLVKNFNQSDAGNNPFIIPKETYDDVLGLLQNKLKECKNV